MQATRSRNIASRATWPSAAKHSSRVVRVKAQSDSAGRDVAFPRYSVYKGRAALAFKAIMPTWEQSTLKDGGTGWMVGKEGALLFEFAQASASHGAQQSFGERTYAWDNKLTFALKATELGSLIDLENSPTKSISLIHDPNKGKENAGSVTKNLKISPGAKDTDGTLLFTLSQSGPQKSSIMVPVTRSEFVVIATLARYLLPRMLGFDLVAENNQAQI